MGWERIEERLRRRPGGGGPSIIPYLTVGFPDAGSTLELVPALEDAGAAIVELGVPFSDPLADGVTIQRASHQALQHGVTLRGCLEECAALRRCGVGLPLVLMGYYNPFLAYGLERVAEDAAEAGVDGLIVPDLPVEESGPLQAACSPRGVAVVPLLAPTSTEERVARACAHARGFIYCAGVLGTTGARQELPSEAANLVSMVRRHTGLPVAVGFGVSTREQVAALGAVADAVVVGSALLEAVADAPQGNRPEAARAFLGTLGSVPHPVEGRRP